MSGGQHKPAVVQTLGSLSEIAAEDWDRLANPEPQNFNPFVSHAFLMALEKSGSAVAETGWLAQHIVLNSGDGELLGVMPCYLKGHSRGEYVFDWGWADAYERAGGDYYPKLQCAVPFTPATGPRFLAGKSPDRSQRLQLLGEAVRAVCNKIGASSVHVTFLPEEDCAAFDSHDAWLRRTDTQFHWHNRDFDRFDDFLLALSSRKRKNIRKERAAVAASGLAIEALTGSDIREHHWDAFYDFYLDTGGRKWGTPYLTRRFFSMISDAMAEQILLVMVKRNSRPIAGALNFIGGDALYGRNWGACEHHPFLHFEACYYQAIDYAITNRLKRVEAGAQGPHKLARGYVPVTTHSLHHLRDPRFAAAVSDYLEHEREHIAEDNRQLSRHAPFRKQPDEEEGDF